MAIFDSDITTRLSKHPSDSCDERPSKSKRDIISSQMNDALQSMAEATKARIEASKARLRGIRGIRGIPLMKLVVVLSLQMTSP